MLQAAALEFRATAEHGAVFFDGPANTAKRLFVASKGYPLEVLVEAKDWVRVRDQSGALAWVEKKSLTNTRSVVITAAKAELHASPDAKSPIVMMAEKNVTFELVEAGKMAWAKVKHRDGTIAFIRIEDVWGL